MFNISKIVCMKQSTSIKYTEILNALNQAKLEIDAWSKTEILNTLDLHESNLIDSEECAITIRAILG